MTARILPFHPRPLPPLSLQRGRLDPGMFGLPVAGMLSGVVWATTLALIFGARWWLLGLPAFGLFFGAMIRADVP